MPATGTAVDPAILVAAFDVSSATTSAVSGSRRVRGTVDGLGAAAPAAAAGRLDLTRPAADLVERLGTDDPSTLPSPSPVAPGLVRRIVVEDVVWSYVPEAGDMWFRAAAPREGGLAAGRVRGLFPAANEIGSATTTGAPGRYRLTLSDPAAAFARAWLLPDERAVLRDLVTDAAAQADVAVDAAGRVSVFTETLTFTDLVTDRPVVVSTTWRFRSYGQPVDVTPPPDDQVIDAPEGA